jgi:hypothetical protein
MRQDDNMTGSTKISVRIGNKELEQLDAFAKNYGMNRISCVPKGEFIMEQIALTIFTGILIAAATSWITVQLSLKRFREEKWWERKADAYSNIRGIRDGAQMFCEKWGCVLISFQKANLYKNHINRLLNNLRMNHFAMLVDI